MSVPFSLHPRQHLSLVIILMFIFVLLKTRIFQLLRDLPILMISFELQGITGEAITNISCSPPSSSSPNLDESVISTLLCNIYLLFHHPNHRGSSSLVLKLDVSRLPPQSFCSRIPFLSWLTEFISCRFLKKRPREQYSVNLCIFKAVCL